MLVLGLRRMRLIRELPPDKPFRVAEVALAEDTGDIAAQGGADSLSRQLVEVFHRVLPKIPEAHEQFDELLEKQVSLGMLTDIVAYTLDIDLDFKERLLAENRVEEACALLVDLFAAARKATFPPEFSVN